MSNRLLYLILGLFLSASTAFADSALDVEESGLRLKLDTDASDNWYTLAITSLNNTPVAPEVFALENPPRLVVDVPGFPVKAARQALVKSGRIAGLRVGVHPGKLRLVFDLRDPQIPTFSSSGESSGASALVTFNFGAVARQPVVPTQETPPELRPPQESPEVVGIPTVIPPVKPPVAPVATSSTASSTIALETEELPLGLDKPLSPQQEEVLNRSEDLGLVPKVPRDPVEITSPEAVSSAPGLRPEVIAPRGGTEISVQSTSATGATGATSATSAEAALATSSESPVIADHSTVKGIFFKSTPEYGPSLVVSIDSLGKYSLVKKQETLFELVLENTQFAGPHLELPQFSPDTFDGLDVLVAEKRGGDVVLKIYTGEGVRLAPFRIKGELWIRIVK